MEKTANRNRIQSKEKKQAVRRINTSPTLLRPLAPARATASKGWEQGGEARRNLTRGLPSTRPDHQTLFKTTVSAPNGKTERTIRVTRKMWFETGGRKACHGGGRWSIARDPAVGLVPKGGNLVN